MGTFVQKQNKLQRQTSSSLRRGGTSISQAVHEKHPALPLPRTLGNQAVQPLSSATDDGLEMDAGATTTARFAHDFSRIPVYAKAPAAIQTKLTVNAPGDTYEREADRVAERVMHMPEQQMQRACACGGQEHRAIGPSAVADGFAAELGAGIPLEPDVRAFFEPRFGQDFSDVRVHTDAQANVLAGSIDALAFTTGRNVAFRAGQYAPHTQAGQRLLAHELTHIVQQMSAGGVASQTHAVSEPGDDAEREAERVADAVTSLRAGATQPIIAAAPTARLLRRHLTTQESLDEFTKQIDPSPSAGPSIVESGQFYWSKRLHTALVDKVRGYFYASALGVYYKAYWTALPTTKIGTGNLEQDVIAMGRALFEYKDETYLAYHGQITAFTIKSKDKSEPEVKAIATLMGPAADSADSLYQKYWGGYLLKGTVFDFAASANKAHLTYSTLFALHHQKEQGACGETAGVLANFFTGSKKGFSSIDTDKKRSPAKMFSKGITSSYARDKTNPKRGDVAVYVPLAGVIANLKDALDDGIIFVSRVYSGLHANDHPGGDGFEHSINIIGYDGDDFVFWDPDSAASIGVGGHKGFGLLHYDSGKNRLTTAKNDADMEVNSGGNHVSGQHRYQPGSLIGK